MEAINFVIAVPLGIIALHYFFIGWRRGVRFHSHDYEGDDTERLRDNFFSCFTTGTSISCIVPILAPLKSWGTVIPITLLLLLIVTPMVMLGQYLRSFIGNVMIGLIDFIAGGRIRNDRVFWKIGREVSTLEWYEFTPFAFISGWIVYYLVYVSLLWRLGFKINSDNVPVWITIIGFIVGIITAVLLTIGIYRKFKNK